MSRTLLTRQGKGMAPTGLRRIVPVVLVAALAHVTAAFPLPAQTVHAAPEGTEITVQNNHSVPVSVFLDSRPFDRLIGRVEPLSTETLTLSPGALDDQDRARLLIRSKGGVLVQAEVPLHRRDTQESRRFALMVPAERQPETPTVANGLFAASPAPGQTSLEMSEGGEITVQNNRNVPVSVFLDSRPFERLLGRIEPLSTETLTLPAWARGDWDRVQLLIRPQGEHLARAEVPLHRPMPEGAPHVALMVGEVPRLALGVPQPTGPASAWDGLTAEGSTQDEGDAEVVSEESAADSID